MDLSGDIFMNFSGRDRMCKCSQMLLRRSLSFVWEFNRVLTFSGNFTRGGRVEKVTENVPRNICGHSSRILLSHTPQNFQAISGLRCTSESSSSHLEQMKWNLSDILTSKLDLYSHLTWEGQSAWLSYRAAHMISVSVSLKDTLTGRNA